MKRCIEIHSIIAGKDDDVIGLNANADEIRIQTPDGTALLTWDQFVMVADEGRDLQRIIEGAKSTTEEK